MQCDVMAMLAVPQPLVQEVNCQPMSKAVEKKGEEEEEFLALALGLVRLPGSDAALRAMQCHCKKRKKTHSRETCAWRAYPFRPPIFLCVFFLVPTPLAGRRKTHCALALLSTGGKRGGIRQIFFRPTRLSSAVAANSTHVKETRLMLPSVCRTVCLSKIRPFRPWNETMQKSRHSSEAKHGKSLASLRARLSARLTAGGLASGRTGGRYAL